jgi:L-aminopeptidase/D-esterase-like protein
MRFKGQPAPATATTIGLVATDAKLTKAECKRLAIMANDGLSKALRPVHAPNDGDTVFAAATGKAGAGGDPFILTELGTVAADCMARAIARGVYEATALPFARAVPDWRSTHGKK